MCTQLYDEVVKLLFFKYNKYNACKSCKITLSSKVDYKKRGNNFMMRIL